MITEGRRGAGAKDDAEGAEEWAETYKDLHKLSIKMGQTVRV